MLGTISEPGAGAIFLSQSPCGGRYGDVSPGRVETWELRTSIPAQHASESEFESIFLEHYPRVLGILMRLTGDRAQAEDLANDVFWRLSRRPLDWLLTNNVGAWLYRTATHAGIDALRSANRRKGHERNAASSGCEDGTALTEVLRSETCSAVRNVLAAMKPAQAELLLMRADGCSYKELAHAVGVAPASVGTLLSRAETEFRKRYLKLTGNKERL
jgi:RNA polymerase sigma-70 factor, ECF subfamily